MSKFLNKAKLLQIILVIMLAVIAAVAVADIIYINQFNSEEYEFYGAYDNEGTGFLINTKTDSTGAWIKSDYELNGETVDLYAQTFDGIFTNNSAFSIRDWSFTIYIQGDCFINNAWCGTMEIHQHVADDAEKVQTLDLRNYDVLDITLDYLYDGDLLIPLSAGDYIVYLPSKTDSDNELPIEKNSEMKMGFIFYFQDELDLTCYSTNYQFKRSYFDCPLFYVGLGIALLWLLILNGYLISRMAYKSAVNELEMKKSGISSMSDMYSIIYIIDLKKNELIPVVADKESEKLRTKELTAQEQLQNLFELDSKELFTDLLLSFCDLETIRDRMAKRNTIVCEYISVTHGWCQIRFFTMERGEDNKPDKLIFTIQVIDEEKKELEGLNAEVNEKTENIIRIQQRIVMGLANMIENRDTNTGGHVKRTSDEIRIIVNEIQREGLIKLDAQQVNDIVRAAPMHDLGKISIDSSILCKPGRLTNEEFEIMKTHSTKSGEMVQILLSEVEEKHFVNTAFNIARYHHERWDGKGYPEGLKGEEIPLEARIMAVADVYDALVSKRCYKEPMSFEQAYNIMIEGMGTQFDPQMKEVFIGCRKELEAYYRE